MKTLSLGDINLLDIGNTIQMAGTVWTGNGMAFITQIPGKNEDFSNLCLLPMDLSEWERFLRQSDLVEVEMFRQDPTGKLVKILARKTQRQIDAYVQWAAFARDKFTCRYCGRTGIPLTVDHVDLWEEGGATILENLISTCRKCNKDRGNMRYEIWIASPIYLQKSKNISDEARQMNLDVLNDLPRLRSLRVTNIRTR